MLYNSKDHLTRFNEGDTVYYRGRGDSSYYTLNLDTKEQSSVQEITFSENKGEKITAKILTIFKGGHDFLRGFFRTFVLDNGTEIHSFDCFGTEEEYNEFLILEEEYNNILKSRKEKDWDNLEFPQIRKIYPKLIADDLIGVQPLFNPDGISNLSGDGE